MGKSEDELDCCYRTCPVVKVFVRALMIMHKITEDLIIVTVLSGGILCFHG